MVYRVEQTSNDVLTLKQRFQNKRIELVKAGEDHHFVFKTENARTEGFTLDQAMHELKHGNHGSFQKVERVVYVVSDPKTRAHETVSTMEVMLSLGGRPNRWVHGYIFGEDPSIPVGEGRFVSVETPGQKVSEHTYGSRKAQT